MWVANADISQVSRIDARTNEVTATPSVGNTNICCLAAGGGYAWVATNPDHQIWKLDAQGKVTTSIELAGVIENVTYSDGAVWAAEGDAGTIVRIDPTTDEQRVYRLGHHLAGVAAGNGMVAVGVQQSAQDVTADMKGRVIRVALKDDYLDWSSPDPAATQTAFNPYQVQFQYATCAKLYNYRDASGAAGRQLAPEVAAGWPRVSQEGHTYTFRIRRGYRFSPPSNSPVTAASFAREIERVLSPRLQPGPWKLALLPDVVGAVSLPRRKDHASLGRHRARRPTRDPARQTRLRPSSSPRRSGLLRGTGPDADRVERRRVADPVGRPVLPRGAWRRCLRPQAEPELLRPETAAPRRHRLPNRSRRPAGGRTRGARQGRLRRRERRRARAGRGRNAATAGRYRVTANNWTEGLALNPHRSLFADGRARRAVAFALDRHALVAGLTGGDVLPTSAVLPPSAADARGPGYPLGGDLNVARRLMAGHHVRALFATYADATGAVFDPRFVRVLVRRLAAIGISVTVVPVRQTDGPAQQSALFSAADIARVAANASQTHDPVEYLRSLPYLRPSDRTNLRRIAGLPSPHREAAAAPIATELERDAIVIGVGNRATPELVSTRLGCVVEQPEYPGLDLAALCLPGARG